MTEHMDLTQVIEEMKDWWGESGTTSDYPITPIETLFPQWLAALVEHQKQDEARDRERELAEDVARDFILNRRRFTPEEVTAISIGIGACKLMRDHGIMPQRHEQAETKLHSMLASEPEEGK